MSSGFTSILISLLNQAQTLPPVSLSNEQTTARYFSYVTESNDQFYAIANSLISAGIEQVPASSTIIFEINQDNQIYAWSNDEPTRLPVCGFECTLQEFVEVLGDMVTDVESTCLMNSFI